jgi:hypothetical protein
MALQSRLSDFEHKYFLSVNNRDDAQSIGNYYAANVDNWIIRNRGQIEMRDGLTAKGTSPSATNIGAAQLIKQGTKYLLRVIDGAANSAKFQHSTNGSTWTDVTGGGSKTTGQVWKFVQANEIIYGVNGTDTPIKYDGSTVSTVSAIPVGEAIGWFRNHLFVGGVAAVPDRLYYSNINDPETFGGSAYINVNLGDGSPIVGLKGIGGTTGRLLVGKERSVWYLTGFTSTDFAISPLTFQHGIASQESMIEVGNDVWGIDLEGNINSLYRSQYDVPFTKSESDDIQEWIAGLNKASINKTTAIYFNSYAMFFVPNGVDSYNSLVLVYDTLANEGKGGWSKFTGWDIARAVVFNQTEPQLYLFDSREGNGQAYQWAGTSDNGLAIRADYETKIYDHGYSERLKNWKFSIQYAPTLGSVNLQFFTSIDRYYYQLVKTVSLAGSSDVLWDVAEWDVDNWSAEGFVRNKIILTEGGAINKGYSIQVRLRAESSTTKIKLRRFTLHYRVLGLR